MTDNPHMVHRLPDGDRDIILIGTAHVSRESVRLVEEVITAETPDTVCVELCASRYQALRQKDRWRDMDIIKVIREKKAFLLLSNLMLAAFQKRIAAEDGGPARPGDDPGHRNGRCLGAAGASWRIATCARPCPGPGTDGLVGALQADRLPGAAVWARWRKSRPRMSRRMKQQDMLERHPRRGGSARCPWCAGR